MLNRTQQKKDMIKLYENVHKELSEYTSAYWDIFSDSDKENLLLFKDKMTHLMTDELHRISMSKQEEEMSKINTEIILAFFGTDVYDEDSQNPNIRRINIDYTTNSKYNMLGFETIRDLINLIKVLEGTTKYIVLPLIDSVELLLTSVGYSYSIVVPDQSLKMDFTKKVVAGNYSAAFTKYIIEKFDSLKDFKGKNPKKVYIVQKDIYLEDIL